MDVLLIFIIIALIIILGFLGEIIFEKTKIPDVIFLIIIGMVLGVTLDLGPQDFAPGASIFATFTLVFLLFQGALNISFAKLFKSLKQASMLTILSFTLTVTAVTIGSILVIGLDFLPALLLGMILGGTSSAVIIPMVNGLRLPDKYGVVLTLESALSDVLTIIGSITVMGIITTGTLSSSSVVNTILSSFALALVIGLAIGIVWAIVLARFPRVKNSHMLTIAIIIALYAVVESAYVGASGAIAALVFGLILGNAKPLLVSLKNAGMKLKEKDVKKTVLSESARSFYSEIGFFVKVFFFVYLGLLINISDPLILLWGAILTFIIYLVRPFATYLTFSEYLRPQNKVALQALIPKGLAAAVLAQLAVQEGIAGAEQIVAVVLSVVFLSILLTSAMILLNQKGLFNGFYSWGK